RFGGSMEESHARACRIYRDDGRFAHELPRHREPLVRSAEEQSLEGRRWWDEKRVDNGAGCIHAQQRKFYESVGKQCSGFRATRRHEEETTSKPCDRPFRSKWWC